MTPTLIYYPCLTLMLLTFFVLGIMVTLRVSEVRAGRVDARYFKTYEGGENLPRKMLQSSRNLTNLLEMPTIFYALCLFALYSNNVDRTMLAMAWMYVAFRIAHTIVHITSNKILPRMTTYGLSCLILLIMAVRLGLSLA